MKCTTLNVDGIHVIACGGRRITKCSCGRPASKLCDWKIAPGRTCDTPVCDACATSPAEGKDLCKLHAETWKDHPKNKAVTHA